MKKGCFWCLTCFLLLWISPFCYGQAIRVRVINGKNGHPLPKQQVSVSLLYEGNETKPAKYDAIQHFDTDANGLAQFSLPEPAPAHLSVGVRLTSEHWHCGCAAPALVVTKELIQKGIVEGREIELTLQTGDSGARGNSFCRSSLVPSHFLNYFSILY
jgi:hypothetical protein